MKKIVLAMSVLLLCHCTTPSKNKVLYPSSPQLKNSVIINRYNYAFSDELIQVRFYSFNDSAYHVVDMYRVFEDSIKTGMHIK